MDQPKKPNLQAQLESGWYWGAFAEALLERFGSTAKKDRNRNYRSQDRDGAERCSLQLLDAAIEVLGFASLALRQTKGTHACKAAP